MTIGRRKFSRSRPGDELFEAMPEHVQKLYFDALALRRGAQRSQWAANQSLRPPAGLSGPEAMLDFLNQ